MDEVGRQMDHPTVSQMVYPIMQMADIAMLGVDAAVGGIDQRKIHMLAREHLPNFKFPSPVCIHTPILNGLDGKKMSSSQGNYISVADSEEEIRKKCQKAFCPPEIAENPSPPDLPAPHLPPSAGDHHKAAGKIRGRPDLCRLRGARSAYGKGEIHPLDLKKACGEGLVEILAPVRDYIREQKDTCLERTGEGT